MSGEGSVWRFHVVVVQNNGKEMYKKSVQHVQSCFFANSTYCFFVCLFFFGFTVFVTVASLHDFIFCLNKL